jgi:hypothetical protein
MPILQFARETREKLAFAARRRRIHRRFRRRVGYVGNFEQPRSYLEKIQYRKLYGNHEFYAMVADKYLVREYVAQRVGSQYLIPLLGVHDRLTPEVFDTLPDQFIIKANHGCKWQRIVEDKKELDVPATVKYFDRLMKKRFGKRSGEFHYSLIQPKIVIEELLTDNRGVLANYELFCFHSRKGFDCSISVVLQRLKRSIDFGKDWDLWERHGGFSDEDCENYVNPENSDKMFQVAETLSADFDFARIDLYNIHGRIYFGEITCTPGAGFKAIRNESTAAKLTEMWHLDVDNPRLYSKSKAA